MRKNLAKVIYVVVVVAVLVWRNSPDKAEAQVTEDYYLYPAVGEITISSTDPGGNGVMDGFSVNTPYDGGLILGFLADVTGTQCPMKFWAGNLTTQGVEAPLVVGTIGVGKGSHTDQLSNTRTLEQIINMFVPIDGYYENAQNPQLSGGSMWISIVYGYRCVGTMTMSNIRLLMYGANYQAFATATPVPTSTATATPRPGRYYLSAAYGTMGLLHPPDDVGYWAENRSYAILPDNGDTYIGVFFDLAGGGCTIRFWNSNLLRFTVSDKWIAGKWFFGYSGPWHIAADGIARHPHDLADLFYTGYYSELVGVEPFIPIGEPGFLFFDVGWLCSGSATISNIEWLMYGEGDAQLISATAMPTKIPTPTQIPCQYELFGPPVYDEENYNFEYQAPIDAKEVRVTFEQNSILFFDDFMLECYAYYPCEIPTEISQADLWCIGVDCALGVWEYFPLYCEGGGILPEFGATSELGTGMELTLQNTICPISYTYGQFMLSDNPISVFVETLGIAMPDWGWQAGSWVICFDLYQVTQMKIGALDFLPYISILFSALGLIPIALFVRR